jgi:DNA-binding winged helix-turn-helix (wHTH) protein/Tfp pilus assembly protein PilF
MRNLLKFGPFRLDVDRRLLFRDQEIVSLPSKALETLLVLVQHSGEVVSKEVLMNTVWPDAFVEEGNLSQNIHVLRRVLGETANEHRYIITVPGLGYRFVALVDVPDGDPDSTDGSGSSGRPIPYPTPVRPGHLSEIVSWLRSNLQLQKRWMIPSALLGVILVFGVLESLPVIARTFNNRGVQLQQRGEIEGAIADYERALRLSSNYAEAHYNLADAYEEIPDYDKALDEYQKSIDADPKFYPAYNNLSRLYILRRKDYGAALGLLDRALNQKPSEPSVRYSLYKNYGWANLELRHLGQAAENLGSALALDPDGGAAHCLLAKVFGAQEKADLAFKEWEQCVAYSSQPEVESEWRNEAQEHLRKEAAH